MVTLVPTDALQTIFLHHMGICDPLPPPVDSLRPMSPQLVLAYPNLMDMPRRLEGRVIQLSKVLARAKIRP